MGYQGGFSNRCHWRSSAGLVLCILAGMLSACELQTKKINKKETGTAQSASSPPPSSIPILSFANVLVGSESAIHVFTITNSGTSTATGCTAAVLAGPNAAEFSIVSQTCGTGNLSNVAGSNTCRVEVKARPTSVGAKFAHLSRHCVVGGMVQTNVNGLSATAISSVPSSSLVTLPHEP